MLDPAEVKPKAAEAAALLEKKLGAACAVAVVLGTGWDGLADGYPVLEGIGFGEVPGFGAASAPEHAGRIDLVETSAGPVIVQRGRLHRYEGYSSLETTFPVWVYGAMGVKVLVLLSAVGSLNPAYMAGDLIVIRDHVFLWGDNPLIGIPGGEGSDRFMPAADFYPGEWRDALKASLPVEVRCEIGVYAYATGPSFETEAEATLLRLAGADVVGMSTAPEAIVGRYLGMKVAAMCCVSNVVLPFRAYGGDVASLLRVVRDSASRLEGFLETVAQSTGVIG